MGLAGELRQLLQAAPGQRELEAAIEEELLFHVDQLEHELVAGGMPREEARAAALRRFGNVDRYRAECRRVQLGGFVMLQRVTLVLLVLLVALVAWLSYQNIVSQQRSRAQIEELRAELTQAMQAAQARADRSQPAAEPNRIYFPGIVSPRDFSIDVRQAQQEAPLNEESTTVETWLERFRQDASQGKAADDRALSLRRECSDDRAREVLHALWPKLDPKQRSVLLETLVDSRSELLARDVVHLGATDPDPKLAARAFELLRELAFVVFDVEVRADYLAWYEANKNRSLDEIVADAAPNYVQELAFNSSAWSPYVEQRAQIHLHTSMPAVNAFPEILRKAGAVQMVQKWARSDLPRARLAAVRWLGALQVDEVTARMIMMPLLADTGTRDPEFVPAVCETLVMMDNSWSWEPLLAELGNAIRANRADPPHIEVIAAALSHTNAEKSLPTVLAWICKAASPRLDEVLGRETLPSLADVPYESFHDAAWWLNWWKINGGEYDHSKDTENGLPRVD